MGTTKEFNTVIEIPKESNHKYEYNPELETFELDRILLPAMRYPGNYGFIPQTIAMDGDALDVLVVNAGTINLGAVVKCYPIAGLDMYDDGKRDVKIICMPTFHHRKEKFTKIDDFDPYFVDQLHHFFSHYKDFDKKEVEIKGWLTSEECEEVIEDSTKRFGDYQESLLLSALGFGDIQGSLLNTNTEAPSGSPFDDFLGDVFNDDFLGDMFGGLN
jgi:inorganic pyrophosphatase|tara:strand:+ start:147 stop:794 length:648 start_codon:yes stop_codon:yes gene_type:complete